MAKGGLWYLFIIHVIIFRVGWQPILYMACIFQICRQSGKGEKGVLLVAKKGE